MVSLELSETTATALSAQAAAQELTIETHLEHVLLSAPSPPAPRLPRDDLERLLDEKATSGCSPVDFLSRAELYNHHD